MSIYDDPYAEIILLAEITYYDLIGAVEGVFYAASEDFTTAPADSVPNTHYVGCIQEDVFFERSAYAGELIGGRSIPDFGSLKMINAMDADGGTLLDFARGNRLFDSDGNPLFDADGRALYDGDLTLTQDIWADPTAIAVAGRSIRLYVHDKRNEFSARVLVMDGKSAALSVEEDIVTLVFKSQAGALERSIIQSVFAGTGGDEGTADMAGQSKQLVFGKCSNVPIRLLDNATLRGLVSDSVVQNFDAVRDKGILLTIATDYTEDKPNGIVDLVAAPDGDVTVDVQGSTLGGSYSDKVGNIMAYIAGTLGGLSVNAAAITALNIAAPQSVGLFIGDDVTMFDALDALSGALGNPGITHGINRAGEFTAALFVGAAGTATLAINADDGDILDGSLTRTQVGTVASKVTLSGKKNWLQQDKSAFALAVTDTDKEKYGREFQFSAPSEDTAVLAAYPEAITLDIPTLMQDSAELAARAISLRNWWKTPRFAYAMTTNLQPLQVDINATINVTHPRYGLAAGKNLLVVRLREYYLLRQVELTGVA